MIGGNRIRCRGFKVNPLSHGIGRIFVEADGGFIRQSYGGIQGNCISGSHQVFSCSGEGKAANTFAAHGIVQFNIQILRGINRIKRHSPGRNQVIVICLLRSAAGAPGDHFAINKDINICKCTALFQKVFILLGQSKGIRDVKDVFI